MALSQKITQLRRQTGWSQEELAYRMDVSRQAVSKWESGQTVPDLDRIVQLARLFGVSTDHLLLEEVPSPGASFPQEATLVRRVTLEQAKAYLAGREEASVRIAFATLLCILSVMPMILLGMARETGALPMSENLACGIGLGVLLVLVAFAVAIFVGCGFRNALYAFLDTEPFEVEHGVQALVRERQKAYRPTYNKYNLAGTVICVLSPLPLLMASFTEQEMLTVEMLCVTMLLAGVGAMFFIMAGVRWASLQKLAQEGEYAPREKHKNRRKDAIGTVYWLGVTAVYFAWSFYTFAWNRTWIVWPVAAVVFALVMHLCDTFLREEGK